MEQQHPDKRGELFSAMYRPFRVDGCNKKVCLLGNHIIIVEEVGRYAVKLVDISSEVNAVTIFGAEDIADIVYVADKDDFVEAIAIFILANRPMGGEVIGCLC